MADSKMYIVVVIEDDGREIEFEYSAREQANEHAENETRAGSVYAYDFITRATEELYSF